MVLRMGVSRNRSRRAETGGGGSFTRAITGHEEQLLSAFARHECARRRPGRQAISQAGGQGGRQVDMTWKRQAGRYDRRKTVRYIGMLHVCGRQQTPQRSPVTAASPKPRTNNSN